MGRRGETYFFIGAMTYLVTGLKRVFGTVLLKKTRLHHFKARLKSVAKKWGRSSERSNAA